jgi:vanillate O-demethylase monooxygenase subunit
MGQTTSAYLANAWYMAAWSSEIGEPLLRRRICGSALLLFRKADGGVAALSDRCPHRFAPLSRGRREGDVVHCAYHGLAFGADGQCVHNPFAQSIPKGATVRSWPVVERDGIVWLWAGDSEAADESLIADFSMLIAGDGTGPIHGHLPMDADYEYGTDNLMDLSHIEFVHTGSFAGQGVIFAGMHEVLQDGDTLHSNWWMPDVAAPSHTIGIYDREVRTDHWLNMRWNAPATMMLEVGATPKGEARETGVIVHQAHILTPESDGTSHYFWATSRPGPASPEGDAYVAGILKQAFIEEDKPIIEAAYANLDGEEFWSQKPVFLGIDAGGTRARRLLQTMIERQGVQAGVFQPA